MAGEQKGKAYEAFTKAVLESLKKKRLIRGSIFWDQKPEGMTIVPDLTIGRDKDNLDVVFLITHSGAAGNSHMKTWRNMGELVESKIFLNRVPKVFNIAFDSIIKENLKLAQAASFDGQLIVGDLKYGPTLQKWIDENLSRFPKDKHEKVDFITNEVRKDKSLKSLLDRFAKDLEMLLKKKAPVELEQVWTMERKRSSGRAPRARDTFVRRGLSKLLIFEDVDVALRLFSGKGVKAEEVPEYAYELGLASRLTLGNSGIAKPADQEIVNAVATIGDSATRKSLKSAPTVAIAEWIATLRDLSRVTLVSKYIATNLANLRKPGKLAALLERIYLTPGSVNVSDDPPASWKPKTVWLLDGIMEILKHSSGNSAGFGYAQLAKAVADPRGPAKHHKREDAEYLLSPWGHLSEWISRVPGKTLPNNVIEAFCCVLADRLSELTAGDILSGLDDIKDGVRNNVLEAKLCTYRGFEPLRLLIEANVPGCKLDKIRSCFGEKAKLPGQATKTTVLRKGKTLINWQSASNAGRDHKKKELCGRAVALRYSWDAKANKFIRRPGVEKLILVVDGTWKRDDLLALARAGWDEIFYPDEMDKLTRAIV